MKRTCPISSSISFLVWASIREQPNLLESYNLLPPDVSRKRQVPMILPKARLAGATSLGTLRAAFPHLRRDGAALYGTLSLVRLLRHALRDLPAVRGHALGGRQGPVQKFSNAGGRFVGEPMNAGNFRVVPVFCAPWRSAQAEVESLEIVRSITDEFLQADRSRD
jgi:hypothetical protein